MKLLISCLLCMLCGSLCAKEADRLVDTQILAHYVKDWGNTRTAHSNCHSAESNHSVPGGCTSSKRIDIYYLTSALAHISARKVLPNRFGRFLENKKVNLNAHFHESYSSLDVRVNF